MLPVRENNTGKKIAGAVRVNVTRRSTCLARELLKNLCELYVTLQLHTRMKVPVPTVKRISKHVIDGILENDGVAANGHGVIVEIRRLPRLAIGCYPSAVSISNQRCA
jgi:hypothetical protein